MEGDAYHGLVFEGIEGAGAVDYVAAHLGQLYRSLQQKRLKKVVLQRMRHVPDPTPCQPALAQPFLSLSVPLSLFSLS